MSDLRRLISDVTAGLRNRIALTVGRCVLAATEDSTRAQTLQIKGLRGEVLSRVEQLLAYGLTSRVLDPNADGEAEGVMVCVGGNRDHAVVIATEDRRYRPAGQLAKGEVMLYDHQGSRIYLKAGEVVELVAGTGSGSAEIKAATTTAHGDLTAAGAVTDGEGTGGTMHGMREAYNSHTHTDPQGGVTGPPTPQV